MVSIIDSKNRKVSISIFQALAGGGRTIRRPKKAAASAPAPGPASAPAPVAAAPAPAPADNTITPAPEAPAPLAATPTGTTPEWTAAEDAKLLDLKEKNTSWKQIKIMMEGRRDTRERYKELMRAKHQVEATNTKDDDAKKADEGNEKEKREGEGKSGSEKGESPKDENEGKRPVIFIDEGDELDVRELVYLSRLEEHYEEKKWLEIASKFFDKTGKRVNTTQLRDKVGQML